MSFQGRSIKKTSILGLSWALMFMMTSPVFALEAVGEIETVADQSKFNCGNDRPDIPATAFARQDGTVILVSGNRYNFVFSGPSVDQVNRNACTQLIAPAGKGDPALFADQQWLSQLYSFDGKNVTAFIHHEYHGEKHGDKCDKKPMFDRRCWYASTTLAVSNDGGVTFKAPPAPNNLIIAPSTRYEPNLQRVGTFLPKVVGDPAGQRVYVLVSLANRNVSGRIGQCLLRSTDTQMNKWELYDRGKWIAAPKSPYQSDELSTPVKDCNPVVAGNVHSVKYIPKLKKFIAIGATNKTVYSQLSSDLINWETRINIKNFQMDENKIEYRGEGEYLHKRWYFSLLDVNSKSKNFDTVDINPYLYFVEFGSRNVNDLNERLLKRIKIKLE